MESCPECEDSFDSKRSMRIHHTAMHGESIAKDESTCKTCSSSFTYYPSEKPGIYCNDCINSSDYSAGGYSKGKDGSTYQRKKIKQIKYESSCNRCSYSDSRALQFHHKKDKVSGIPEMVNSSTLWSDLLEELRKCEIICANCHSIEHTENF